MDTTFSAPPPGAAPPLTARPSGPPPPQPPNRKELDSKRVLARLVDGLVAGAPAIVVALGVGRSLSVFLVSLSLTYFFICEALWGQTLGKRLLGLRVLGDLLGGTIVARATPGLPHAPLSPLMIVYPLAWAIGAMALVLVPQPENDYLARVDQVCRQRQEAYAATPRDQITVPVMVRWVHADHQAIASLEAPPEVTELRRQVLALSGTMVTTIDQAVARAKASPDPAAAFQHEVAEIQAREQQVDLRYAELGLKACAGRAA
jgi:hypothetical protein